MYEYAYGVYNNFNDVAVTQSFNDASSEQKYEIIYDNTVEHGDNLDLDSLLIKTKSYRIEIDTHRGPVRGQFITITNYEESIDTISSDSESSTSEKDLHPGSISRASSGNSTWDGSSGVALRIESLNQLSLGECRSSRSVDSRSNGSSGDNRSETEYGDSLVLWDHIQIKLDDQLTQPSDSGSGVYLIDHFRNRRYLIGIHRSRHDNYIYVIPLVTILEEFYKWFSTNDYPLTKDHRWILSRAISS